MLKRKIVDKLVSFFDSGIKKTLLLTGARQVGKTTAVRMFAEMRYKHFVEVNFVKNPMAKGAFDGALDTKTIILNLSAMGYGPFVEGATLIFFDEIQECPNARTAIKFLTEEGRYHYIESGSLLGINYKPVTSYPVGFEEEVPIYPLDFEEFLWARGVSADVLETLAHAFRTLTPLPEFIHQQISRYYREYLVIGGMPEVVRTFVGNADFNATLRVQRSILYTYRADISNYAGTQQQLVKRIFDAIPSQLGKEDKRFILASMEKGAALRKYEDPTQWLVDAGLVYYSFNVNALELPLEAVENRRLYKLYMVDTGLLCSLLANAMQFKVLNGDISINEGALTENYVACVLAAKGIPLHYYDKKSKRELDFVVPYDGEVSLIEVKSGDSYKRHASLSHALNEGESFSRAVVLSKFNVEREGAITYLPLYMAMYL